MTTNQMGAAALQYAVWRLDSCGRWTLTALMQYREDGRRTARAICETTKDQTASGQYYPAEEVGPSEGDIGYSFTMERCSSGLKDGARQFRCSGRNAHLEPEKTWPFSKASQTLRFPPEPFNDKANDE